MKPKSASDVLRQLSPRKTIGTAFFTGNRFNPLRDRSPSISARSISSTRDRSVSSKRKASDDPLSYAAIATHSSGAPCPDNTEQLNIKLAKIRSVCDEAASELARSVKDPGIISVFGNIIDALHLTCDLQNDIINAMPAPASVPTTASGFSFRVPDSPIFTSLGGAPKKTRINAQGNSQFSQSQLTKAPRVPTGKDKVDNPEVDPTVAKFKEAVKNAEKCSLLLNLDLGRVPIMNHNTISSKATGALTSMAAANEGKTGVVPSEEAVTAIDDVLSVVKSMQFFGKSTKTYKNTKDPKSGSYCTIPVKYEFKDKDTRIRAETTLRKHCKVHCSTPYPTILRETIRQVIAHVKKDYPDNQVRVNVDLKNLALRVGRRPPPVEGHPAEWQEHKRPISLPPEAFDVSARSVPENFRVSDFPDSPRKEIPKETPMQTEPPADNNTTGRLSRKGSHEGANTPSKRQV